MAPTAENQIIASGVEKSSTIIFNASKNEILTTSEGLKSLQRNLKSHWKVSNNKEELSVEILNQACVFVFGGPREKFTELEFNCMTKYMDSGGSILVLMGEGGEKNFKTNINFFLEEFGIMVNTDSVIRSTFYKYFHPKECLVSDGVLNRSISKAAGKSIPGLQNDEGNDSKALSFLYPFGATLNVAKPAIAVLSTGSIAVPRDRPVCAFYTNTKSGGKLAVLGSGLIFSDLYIDKEENNKIRDVLFQFLTGTDLKLNEIDADSPEITDYRTTPDIAKLAENVRVCLQESDEIPTDYTKLFDSKLFQVDMKVVPNAIKAFEQLSIKHEPLRLITPQFEAPYPPLQSAVFQPVFQELPNPSLELFDLDEAFSSERARLAQVTNKCNEDDLEYYVRECGEILAVTTRLPLVNRSAKHILEFVLAQVVEFKKLNQENEVDEGAAKLD
uniref:ABC-type uncharacterized transport system domain-containing protein n=1 Tax=Strigamia maritima TaxID=126957 RepID=T1JK26_STRMM